MDFWGRWSYNDGDPTAYGLCPVAATAGHGRGSGVNT